MARVTLYCEATFTEIEGSLPDVKGKKFANVNLEAAEAACAEADKQADEPEPLEGADSGG